MFFYLFVAFLAVGGLAVLVLTITKPHLAWLMFFAGCTLTVGLMPFGLTIVDEYIVACIVFGCLISIFLTRETRMRFDPDPVALTHLVLFLVLMVYLALQSVRGIVVMASPRKIRWVVFFLLTFALPILLNTRRFPLPSRSQVLSVVLISTMVYNSIYILHGFIAEHFSSMTRFDLQLVYWGTSAYTMLPAAVGIPAAILSLKSRINTHRRLGYLTLLVIIVAAFYYDSRVTFLSLFGFLAVSVPLIGWKKFAVGTIMFATIFAIFIYGVWPNHRSSGSFFHELVKGIPILFQSEEKTRRSGFEGRDLDRHAQIQVSLKSITQSFDTLFFGFGFRQHGEVISPLLREHYSTIGWRSMARKVQEDTSTEGFTAFLVDTGIVGMALFAANLFFLTWQILRRRLGAEGLLLISAIGVLFFWLFVINILDAIIFYAAIMPSGILLLLAQREETAASPPSQILAGP